MQRRDEYRTHLEAKGVNASAYETRWLKRHLAKKTFGLFVCLFVCGISLMSSQLIEELFPDCTRSCFSQVVLRHRGADPIYEKRCLFVAVGLSARFIVLPHWDNMS